MISCDHGKICGLEAAKVAAMSYHFLDCHVHLSSGPLLFLLHTLIWNCIAARFFDSMPQEVHQGSVKDGGVKDGPLGVWAMHYSKDSADLVCSRGSLSPLSKQTHHRSGQHHDYKLINVSLLNMNWCPALQSHNMVVYLQADGTFGPDDPISWPQLYHHDVPHLPSILISDPDKNSLVGTF